MKAALVLAGCLFCASGASTGLAQDVVAQDRPIAGDPVIAASLKAESEGRLVDEEKILLDAVHKAESSEADRPQVSLYFKRLAGVHTRKDQFTEALDWMRRARALDEKTFGPTDKSVVGDMAAIAKILEFQGSLKDAEEILNEALHVITPELQNSVERGQVLANLGSIYSSDHRWSEAQSAGEEALKTCESRPSMPSSACDCYRGMLAEIYRVSGRAIEADQVPVNSYLPAELANLDNQAGRYYRDGLLAQAEASYRDAISWIERNPNTPAENQMPNELVMLGAVLERQGRDNEAEESYKYALQLEESRAKPQQVFPDCCTVDPLLNLYEKQGRIDELLPILQQALEVEQRNFGEESRNAADTLIALAGVYSRQGKKDQKNYVEAAALYRRGLEIQQKNMGSDHPDLVDTLTSYAQVLGTLHDDSAAAQVQAQIEAIQKKTADETRNTASR